MDGEPTNNASHPARNGPAHAQRRYLTFVFSDLSDSSKLATAMEAEYFAALLGKLRNAYQEVVAKHGGIIARIQGDGMLAIFGYPDAREDGSRRAAQAALALHEAIRSLRVEPRLAAYAPLGLHTGIHSGIALVGEGDHLRGRVDVIGDAPNVAWRLSDVARKDEILVSEAALGPESQFFHTGERQFTRLKGRSEPIAVRRILARSPVSTRFEASVRSGLTPFVGRQFEFEALERCVREAINGETRYAALVGPPGLGKTRLAEEFLLNPLSSECQIQRGYCEDHLSAEPLQPFLQMLRALFGLDSAMSVSSASEVVEEKLRSIDPALLAHRAALLGVLSLAPGVDGSAPAVPAAADAAKALRDLFWNLARSRPMILLLDDWQWADSTTRQVLGEILSAGRHGIFVMVTTRAFTTIDTIGGEARVLELTPLTESEAAQTISRLLPSIDPFVATSIQKSSGGNPLYIEELCHSASYSKGVHEPSVVRGDTAWLDALIESRVARLPDAQAELARVAAVIGIVVPAWLLEALTGCGEFHPLVRELARQDLVFPAEREGLLRFKHGITREVIYASFGLHQRRAMHLRVAEALRERSAASTEVETYEVLAYHYAAGGQAIDAARYAELAGDKAVAASSLDRAQAQYRAALAALDMLTESADRQRRWSSIAQHLGRVCVFDPSIDQLPILKRAVALAVASGDQSAVARAEYWLGYIYYALGEVRAAIHHLERALATSMRVGDESLSLQIRATLGQARVSAGDYQGALPLLDEAIAAGRGRRRTRTQPAVGFAYTLGCKAALLGDQGLFSQAHEVFEEGLNAVRGANHEVEASVLGWQSAVYLWQGRWEDALRCANAGQHVAERVKSHFIFATDHAMSAYASWSMHRSSQSLQRMVDATGWLEDGHRRLTISLNYGWLTEAMLASDRLPEMRRYAARVLLRARGHERLGLAMTYRALARASARRGAHEETRRYLALAMGASRARESRHEITVTRLCEAEIVAGLAQRSAAIALLDQAEAAFEDMQMAWHLDWARRLRALL